MKKLLHIEASPSGNYSVSRSISREYLDIWKKLNNPDFIFTRDLVLNPIPHLDGEAIFANFTAEANRSPNMQKKHEFRLKLIEEITSVDEILISTPMWNWSIPSVLKAYFDQVIVEGVLDGSGRSGLKGKKITFIVAQGGSYKEGAPKAGWDFATGYLNLIAKALGAVDIEIILAEFTLAGVAPGMDAFIDAKKASINAAKEQAKRRAA